MLTRVVRAVLKEYSLPLDGIHGVAHWARVLENGRRLADLTGANSEVVALFAVLHDSRRYYEHSDPEHGPRAADFAEQLRGRVFELDNDEFDVLVRACEGHTHERDHPNVTVQTCWDADRLDLGRVGIMPDPRRLCTSVAQQAETIRWANQRASSLFVPEFVSTQWGVDLTEQLSSFSFGS